MPVSKPTGVADSEDVCPPIWCDRCKLKKPQSRMLLYIGVDAVYHFICNSPECIAWLARGGSDVNSTSGGREESSLA